jgi:hypothetical protein
MSFMRELTYCEVMRVSGGVDNSEANQRIGNAVGTIAHAMSSKEALAGSVFGLAGFIAGAVIHMQSKH